MDREIRERIEILTELARRLTGFGIDTESAMVVERAIEGNGWFTREDIVTAVEAIRTLMLDRELLEEWLEPYDLHCDIDKRVAIIMAGNIPLVGFFDLLCVIVCGCRAFVKSSSKDRILMDYMTDIMRDIAPQIHIAPYTDNQPIDAVIATGSDNTNRYFRTRFSSIPSLLRGSRYSVGVLGADETPEQLALLAHDIFTYSGLGCRNVSRLFVPENYDFRPLIKSLSSYNHTNPKYRNNYLQNRALLTMNGTQFIDGGFFTLRASSDHSLYISEIAYQTYSSTHELTQWLAHHNSQIQCVVGNIPHPRSVPFGRAQSPQLSDYPDAEDVIEFIKKV